MSIVARAVSLATAMSIALAPTVAVAAPPAEAQPPALPAKEGAPTEGDKPAAAGDETGEKTDTQKAVSPCDPTLGTEATRHFVNGEALAASGRYRDAAAEFERAHAACPDARILYNAHLAQDRAANPVASIRWAQRYLELPACGEQKPRPLGAQRCTMRADEVAKTLEQLKGKVGELAIEVEPGVELREIRVGGRVVPRDEFPVFLLPGAVEVELFGLEPGEERTRVPRMTAGETYVLQIRAFSSSVPDNGTPNGNGNTLPDRRGDPDPQPRFDPRRRKQILRTSFWAGLGLTGVSGVALAVVGGLTLRERNRFNDMRCNESPCPLGSSFPFESQDRFNDLRSATNALIGVTAVFAMATAVVGIFAFSKRQPKTGRASVRLRPSTSGRRVGLSLRW